MPPVAWRWVVITVVALASTLNFLDRQLLAAVAPSVRAEFHLSNADYGAIVATFSLTYLVVAPFAGWIIDRVGLGVGLMASVVLWSITGIATGFVGSFRGLQACRLALGAAEAGGIPATSKASAVYLRPREFGLGIAFGSIGVALGSIGAPLVVAFLAPAYGWRSAFVVCGLLGLLWALLFRVIASWVPEATAHDAEPPLPVRVLLGDVRFWGILGANMLVMSTYSLWLNWTTILFVEQYKLTQTQANQYFAWIPPLFATMGGFFGGWLALRSIDRERDGVATRLRICRMVAPALLVNAVVPLMATPMLAAAAISLSVFLCNAFLNNLQVIPFAFWGAGRAAFTTAALASSYALTQIFLPPLIGAIVDAAGFRSLCVGMSVLPLLAIVVLKFTVPIGSASSPNAATAVRT